MPFQPCKGYSRARRKTRMGAGLGGEGGVGGLGGEWGGGGTGDEVECSDSEKVETSLGQNPARHRVGEECKAVFESVHPKARERQRQR